MIVRHHKQANQVTFHDSLGHQIGPTMGYSRLCDFIQECMGHMVFMTDIEMARISMPPPNMGLPLSGTGSQYDPQGTKEA